LHDSVGQALTALRINMDLIRKLAVDEGDAQIRARAEDSVQLIESTFKAVQNVMYDLRPPMLDEFGLVASLRWYSKQFAERTGMHVEVRAPKNGRCGAEVETALFRIAQEALNNVARHSQAKNVGIELRDAGKETLFTVEDDGVGFDTARDGLKKTSYGVVTMRERAEAVGATFEMGSEKGRGTRITVRVPQKPEPIARLKGRKRV
jgi:two-component system sensor histidine kinase UhpB